ncbi:hypothetical protein HDR66_02825, partial [bacterium]|nr:hypothetical protein [bacterium]
MDEFFQENASRVGLWCGAADDDADLAGVADMIAARGLSMISALPDDVMRLWAWLEGRPAKILARFYLPPRGGADVNAISDMTARINAAFKQGAAGAQIFMRAADLESFADMIAPVRDDLFFNRDFSIGLDIGDIDATDWERIFDIVRRLHVGALTLVLTRDAGVRSDFVGRVYAALNNWGDVNCDLHFVPARHFIRIEQVLRLSD